MPAESSDGDDEPVDPTVELELAYGALADADAIRGQGTDRGAVSRLYYACFHAAQAVLYNRGFAPSTHGAVSRLFGREIVLNGDATKADGSFLNNMYNKRQQADYRQSPPTGDVDVLYARTETFVADMAELIEDELDGDPSDV